MTSLVVFPQGTQRVVVPPTRSIAVYSDSDTSVSREFGFPNQPPTPSLLGIVNARTGMVVFGPYATGATIIIDAGAALAYYETGTAPVVQSPLYLGRPQPTPVAVDVTGAVSATAMLGGIVTSSTAAAVAGTVPTGAVMEAASLFAVNDSFEWSVINTGPNAFTVTAAAGHTLVGAAAVATVTSGRFRTRKTAVDTFVTYRLG